MKRLPFVIAALALFAPTLAGATPTPVDPNAAKADQLFKDGTAALDDRRFDVACPKLAESHRIDPKALGTLVNLARCHEEWGKTATAYAEYTELEQGATERKQAERIALAKKHKASLETKLSHIDFKIQAAVAGETVKIDDAEPVDAAKLTATQLFDPGDHAIEANAPGKAPYKSKFTVTAGPSTADVIVPALTDLTVATAQPVTPPPATAPQAKWSTQKTLGVVGMGVGGAGLVVGAIFGVVAIGAKSTVESDCNHLSVATLCGKNAAATSDYKSANTDATISTIGFIAGGVLAAAGAALFLTAPTGTVEVAPAAGANSGGISLRGTF